jgi:hypothetical protein
MIQMAKSTRDSTKNVRLTVRGTPRKRNPKAGTPVVVRLQDDESRQLDDWIAQQRHEHLSRPEAVRRILKLFFGKGTYR